ncbi:MULTISPECIES: ABC transporter permease [unclassified Legionella]|uniref:ABC transporter permease n=1 Tax=unclassified Legionella TaxID=2622702 RepID=UPI0010557A08|nr:MULTISPECIES: ABC transporter permease [unclassified Legionella]MDI9819233.1 ABC transporter permease [Legionella sp. PL877]
MYVFRRIGFQALKWVYSITLIFRFVGHLSHSLQEILFRRLSVSWSSMIDILFHAGVKLVIPLLFICLLLGLSLAQTIYLILSGFHLHHQVLPVAQNIVTHDILPLLLGFLLCVQVALHLITTRIKELRRTPEEVIVDHILPIIIGMSITSLLLYIYTITIIFVSFYLSFRFTLHLTTYEFLIHIASIETIYDLIYSALKTLLLCTVVSLVAGYYYYEAAVHHITLRKAVSRIMTRGSIWLIAVSVYIKFMI